MNFSMYFSLFVYNEKIPVISDEFQGMRKRSMDAIEIIIACCIFALIMMMIRVADSNK